ncbi:hypothetical protein ACO229_17915 [Promicromonospora sp. MS192]|uniref:hypothetical protein n=1 Tax=Promicromonospora sp. MS192 TaxID=3412684 RepID=UPI003C2DF29D
MKHARSDGPDLAFRIARRVVSAVVDDMSTVQRIGVGVVGALFAVTPFGAWSAAEARTDPLTTGAPVEVGPFEVTIEKAATADELGYLVPAPGNHMLAVVANVTNTGEVPEYSVTLSNAVLAPEGVGIVPEEPLGDLGFGDGATPDDGAASDDSAASDDGATAGDGTAPSDDAASDADPSASPSPAEPELPSATIVNIEDGTTRSILNPGVTYRVALIWEQSGDWSGSTIPLELVELEWIEEDPFGLDDGHWTPNEVAFRGDIAVEPAKPAAGAGQDAAGQDPAGQDTAGQDTTGQDTTAQPESGTAQP